jgi:hypothetical protein
VWVPIFVAGGQLYVEHRNFEAERQVPAGQRSSGANRWAMLEGHEESLATGSLRAVQFETIPFLIRLSEKPLLQLR